MVRYLLGLLLIFLATSAPAADWPMWRFDSGRSAASAHELPDRLSLRYTIEGTPRKPVWDDPLNQDLMPYDQIFEPIIAGGKLILTYNDRDRVEARDFASGEVEWWFYAEGPIRFAPAAHDGRLFVTSDDGHLYCLDTNTGSELWRFRGAPSARKALGNERLISAWPARGGPVVKDDTVYFAASIWPFMGTFIYALDCETGAAKWVNDGTSADYIKQPHNAPSFAGVAPQGALAVSGDRLIVPGGRSPPAVLDRITGDQQYFKFGGKGVGGSLVIADAQSFYVHTRFRGVLAHALESGNAEKFHINEPVLDDEWIYTAADDQAIEAYDKKRSRQWKLAGVDATGDLIRSGSRLYAAGGGKITAVELAKVRSDEPKIAWQLPVEGDIRRLISGNGHLVAVSMEGNVYVFGEASASEPQLVTDDPDDLPPRPPAEVAKVERIIEQVGSKAGYALVFGVDQSTPILSLIQHTEFQIAYVESQADQVRSIRPIWEQAGWYGRRITAHVGNPVSFEAPPYIAHLVVLSGGRRSRGAESESAILGSAGASPSREHIRAAYRSVRPYGGVLWLPTENEAEAQELAAVVKDSLSVQKPHIEVTADGVMAIRRGPLPGAGSWTHQYGDAANSLMSGDRLVKAPVGVLWFGGNSNLDILPRHGHGPPEQVIGGRLYLEGMDSLSCRDVYTGRVIWRREFEDLDTHGIYFDDSYRDTPLSTAYNQKHIFGANARGTNYVATADAVYLVMADKCLSLDPATGETIRTIKLPEEADLEKEWGFVGVVGDVLIAGDGFADYNALVGDRNTRSRFIVDLSASRALIGFDRHTGKKLWRIEAEHSFLHNGIAAGADRVFVLDRIPFSVEERMRRRGKPKGEYRIVAVDLVSGDVAWEQRQGIFGTFLSYSTEHNLLLEGGARAKDRSPDEVGEGMTVYNASDGEIRWTKPDLRYSGPCILHHATVITGIDAYRDSAGAYSLLDGSPRLLNNPLTGQTQPWRITRAYGCNYPIACENMLTFRSGAAGFYDLEGHSGSGNLGGFKSGCTSNLVVADGVLNAPDYTRTCSCTYQNQTSLALVHMPDLEMWTYSKLDSPGSKRIERVGINLGAPGDRRAADGTLWLEHPVVGGSSPEVEVEVEGDDLEYFRRHASQVASSSADGLSWVAASGVEGIRELKLKLADDDSEKAYRVQLHFVEPNPVDSASRTFHIDVQGQRVHSGFSPHAAAGGPMRESIVTIDNCLIGETLVIELVPAGNDSLPPILSGVSVVLVK